MSGQFHGQPAGASAGAATVDRTLWNDRGLQCGGDVTRDRCVVGDV